jgi:glycerol-3-phosphate acyltransferase PlsY
MIYLCLLSGALAYLIGSINTSMLVSAFFGKDIRKEGSGNAGATNTLRTFGKGAAVIVLAGDALKAVVAILLARFMTDFFAVAGESMLPLYVAGLCVVLGHNFPIYFGFKGGKGISTSAAVILMLDWKIGIAVVIFSVLVMAVSKYVSLGSCCGAIIFPALVVFFHKNDIYFVILAVIMAALALVMHRKNIVRLAKGSESKLSFKK